MAGKNVSRPGDNIRQAVSPSGETLVATDVEMLRLQRDILIELKKLNMEIAIAFLSGTLVTNADVGEG